MIVENIRSLDTLDDRREVWSLLARLSPRARYQFLAWACSQCFLPHTRVHPTPSWLRMGKRIRDATAGDESQDLALTNEIYTDLWMLVTQYRLSARATAERLEAFVKQVSR